ncbi:hypothetical protein [Brevundimonas sp.]|uniref:hypothetical protein n=1 Tax=Brevundimonas sp. TaxID=1871086 RepID=UPI002D4FFF7D|nr:hypothetical protein [Brevundimonas sp.]HYC98239.1 hypothetical protein [Brevundimonas sp.]
MNRIEYWTRLAGISFLVPLAFLDGVGAPVALGVVVLVGLLNYYRARATGRPQLGWAATIAFASVALVLKAAIHFAPLSDPIADLVGFSCVALFGAWLIPTLIIGGLLSKDRYEVT